MTPREAAYVVVEAMTGILQKLPRDPQDANANARHFSEVWSEVAAGHETYGSKDAIWTTFIRNHAESDYWRSRIRKWTLERAR